MNNEKHENGLSQSEITSNEITPDEIKGLFVKDYTDLDLNALEEIIQLDEQLDNNLTQIMQFINEGDYSKALLQLKWLSLDNLLHRDYANKCQAEVLDDMECTEASKHFQDYMNEPQ